MRSPRIKHDKEDWESTDALVEVENENNAKALLEHFNNLGVRLFSQRKGWQRVERDKDMPNGYREGTLFITCKEEMPWGNKGS